MRDEVAVLVEKEGAARFSYLDGGDEILHGIEREIEARDACDLTVLAKRRAEAHDRLVIDPAASLYQARPVASKYDKT